MVKAVFAILVTALTGLAAAALVELRREGVLQLVRDDHIFILKDASEIVWLYLAAHALLALAAMLLRARARTVGYGLLALLAFGTLAAFLMHQPRPAIEPYDPARAAPNDRVTLLVGVDGMSWNAMVPLLKQGKLPNLQRLMEEGSYGVLRSLETLRPSTERYGYWSPVVWTSIATGVGEDKHGVIDFSIPDEEGRQRMAHSGHRRVPAFWNIFSAFERPVGVVGWWASWPAEEVSGVLASSNLGLRGYRNQRRYRREDDARMLAQEALTYPASFSQVVAEEIGLPEDNWRFIKTRVYPFDVFPLRDEKDLGVFDSVVWQDRLYLEVGKYLLRKGEASLYSVYFEGIDAASHNFWEFMAFPEDVRESEGGQAVPPGFDDHRLIVDRYYQIVDEFLGELLALLPDDATVVVCSDHGFQTVPDHVKKADHSGFGVLLARGPGIRRGHNLNLSLLGSLEQILDREVTVLDILPTLLYLHGLPVSLELDGRVLFELFEPGLLRSQGLATVAGYGDFGTTRAIDLEFSGADEEDYRERLKGLGYLN